VLVHIPKGNKNPLVWLADFGLSVDGVETTTLTTKHNYRAPELAKIVDDLRPIENIPPNEREEYQKKRQARASQMEKADVFSFGLVAFNVSSSRVHSQYLNFADVNRFRLHDNI
jgi:hypothetical protein